MSHYNAIAATNTTDAPQSIGPYSHSVAFSHYNNISAQLPLDPRTGAIVAGGIAAQAAQCFSNIQAILHSMHHAMDDVVRITVFVKSIGDLEAVDAVYKTFFLGLTQTP